MSTTAKRTWVVADDGQRIYAESHGAGRSLVCCNGIACSKEYWKYLNRYFVPEHNVVHWDYRAHGRSPVPADLETMTVGRCAEDLRAVLDWNEIEKPVLLGHSMGCQVILEFYARYPDRVGALVPILGTYGRPGDTVLDSALAPVLFPALRRALTRASGTVGLINQTLTRRFGYDVAALTGLIDPDLCSRQDMEAYFEHVASLDVPAFMALLKDAEQHTAEGVLEKINVPTLVVGGDSDLLTPAWLSREMHDRIPGSELLMIPGGTHTALFEQPELINLRLEKFLRERIDGPGKNAAGSRRRRATA